MGWKSRGGWVGLVAVLGCGSPPDPAAPPAEPPQQQPYPQQQRYPQQQQNQQPRYAPQPTTPAMPGQGPVSPQDPSPSPPPSGGGKDLQSELASIDAQAATIDSALAGPATTLSADRCQRLCAALGSMRRSVENVCRLTGEGDPRCSGARNRLKNSERRVTDAGCAC